MTKLTHYLALSALLAFFQAVPAQAQVLDSLSDFDQVQSFSGDKDKISVIVELDVPARAASRNDALIGNGDWVSLGSYIEEAQDKLAGEMGWVNLNDLVKFKTIPAVAKYVTRAELKQLLASGRVKQVHEDSIAHTSLLESTEQIELPFALARGYSGRGKSVAIIDTGVDTSHPFFQDRIVAEACFSATGNCPNRRVRMVGTGAGVPCPQSCRHGTHVAGIAAGKAQNAHGIATDAGIIPVQVFSAVGKEFGTLSRDQIQALEWLLVNAKKFDLVAINMSLGGGEYSSHCDNGPRKLVIDKLRAAGVATIIASGNDGKTSQVSAPACISSAISVGALDKQDTAAPYSNSYRYLSIVAPGGSQSSSRQGGIKSSIPGGNYEYLQGTSMAAPHVAGAWTVLASAYPRASVDQIQRALLNNGSQNVDPRNGLNIPSLNIKATLEQLASVAGGREPRTRPQPDARPAPAPKPQPAPAPQPERDPEPEIICEKRVDGILIEDTTGDCAEAAIQW